MNEVSDKRSKFHISVNLFATVQSICQLRTLGRENSRFPQFWTVIYEDTMTQEDTLSKQLLVNHILIVYPPPPRYSLAVVTKALTTCPDRLAGKKLPSIHNIIVTRITRDLEGRESSGGGEG
ncbi:hypothetical protein J6590_042101 [Homalodisca vitripennis]|nr:hypothetical protein J6590_088054 [Homalodisca vitripennis]KAG8336582.1 hypothetical protein J6590_042101 [Homalodisca vitripennis]